MSFVCDPSKDYHSQHAISNFSTSWIESFHAIPWSIYKIMLKNDKNIEWDKIQSGLRHDRMVITGN